MALGILKLHRSAQDDLFDSNVSVFPRILCDVRPHASEIRGIVESIWKAVDWNLDSYFTLATRYPEHLEKFHQRLDELDNEALHQMAVYAVVGREVADLFHMGNY